MRVVIVGDIHAQVEKFWRVLIEAGLADEKRVPTKRLLGGDIQLVLLGDLVHAKSRERYAELTNVQIYDEFNPEHLRKAELVQENFLREVKAFQDALPAGAMHILMGNHDFNTIDQEQGPLRTDDVSHLEWKGVSGSSLDKDLFDWIRSWPKEMEIEGLHLAHVGPYPEHNTYDEGFYVENRRRWIYEDRDFLKDTPCRLGIYGHTPVRGGVNIASQGRAILIDTNGYLDEYTYLEIKICRGQYRLRMRGLFFDEWVQR